MDGTDVVGIADGEIEGSLLGEDEGRSDGVMVG